MGKSKEYVCPNTLKAMQIDYERDVLICTDPAERHPMALPLGLLVRMLEHEPGLYDELAACTDEEGGANESKLKELTKALEATIVHCSEDEDYALLVQWLATYCDIGVEQGELGEYDFRKLIDYRQAGQQFQVTEE